MNKLAMQNDRAEADVLLFANCELRGWVTSIEPPRNVIVLIAARVIAHQLQYLSVFMDVAHRIKGTFG